RHTADFPNTWGTIWPFSHFISAQSMADIGREAQFAPARTQLPVNSYFDETIFAQEQAHIFAQSARYIGHEKLVPEVGDWHALAQENNGRVLVRNPDGVELLSNV